MSTACYQDMIGCNIAPVPKNEIGTVTSGTSP